MDCYGFNRAEFDTIFARRPDGTRKNRVLLKYLCSDNVHKLVRASWEGHYNRFSYVVKPRTMDEMVYAIKRTMRDSFNAYRLPIIRLMDCIYICTDYELDRTGGICADGDITSIRYARRDNGKIYKMKAGKFYRYLLMQNPFSKGLPHEVITYLCEDFAASWRAYAAEKINGYGELVVDSDFETIYSSSCCPGDFHSCMVDDGYHTFYNDCVKASAASLRNDDGDVIARCVIYDEVFDEDGKVWRLAERQYAADQDTVKMQMLVNALIAKGRIDGYKCVGAGCGDKRAFVDVNGQSLASKRFRIACNIGDDDYVSYQDSFKYYDYDAGYADNYGAGELDLAITGGELEWDWDDYNERNMPPSHSIEVHFDGCWYHTDDRHLEDFIDINGNYYHEDEVYECPECGEMFVKEDRGEYSELLDEYFCCYSCMHDAESDYAESHNLVWREDTGEWIDKDEAVKFLNSFGDISYITKRSADIRVERQTWFFDDEEGVYRDWNDYFNELKNKYYSKLAKSVI